MRQHLASLFFYLLISESILFAQSTSQKQSRLDALWSTVATTNDPTARHENGFVAYNGKLYLIGGRSLKRVQIFDPQTNTWTDGAFPPFQMHHFQALVYNNLIYVIGAYTGTCCDAEFGVANVWVYNPQTDGWVMLDEIPADRRRGSTGAVVYNNKIYIVGGLQGGHGDPATAYSWFDEYDPATGQWKVLPNAPRVRDHFHATVYNGKLYLIGGRNTSVSSITGAPIGEIDVYNFGTNSWSTLGAAKNLPTPRGGASTIYYQGKIFVIGGETSQTLAHNETEAFDPISETWSTLSPLVVGRHGTQAAIYDNAIYLAAGSAQKGGEPELDSMERYADTSVQLVQSDHSLSPGWNMIGLPLNPVSGAYQDVYDDVDLSAGLQPMTWDGSNSYEAYPTLSIGKAFWLKIDDNASDPQVQTITGSNIDALQIQLSQGWNMISGPSCDNVILLGASTNPAGVIPVGSLYMYDEGYEPAYDDVFQRGRLQKGLGYWVFASNSAILTLQCGVSKAGESAAESPFFPEQPALGRLTVSDAAQKSRQLFFAGASRPDLNAEAYNLPPRAYRGSFDARFRNDKRLLDGLDGDIRVQASELPLRITFDLPPADLAGQLMVSWELSDHSLTARALKPGDELIINNDSMEFVNMRFVEDVAGERPETFVLHGNYPNPFNPTTRIVFDLPADGDVDIRVIDMLGRMVMRKQVRGITAGTGLSVSLDAGDLPAGAYAYSITATLPAETISRTGRIVLLK